MSLQDKIDRYLNIVTSGGAVFSPDESKIAFVSNKTGHIQVYEMGLDGGEVRQVIVSEDRRTNPRYLPDGTLLFSGDHGGDENFQLFVYDGSTIHQISKKEDAKYRYAFHTDNAVYVSANDVDSKRFDVYRIQLPVTENKFERVVEGFEFLPLMPRCADDTERILVLTRSSGNLWTDMYLLQDGELSYLTNDYEKVFFSPIALLDSDTLLVTSDHEREFQSLALFDIGSRELTFLEGDDWNTEEVKYHKETGQVFYSKNVDGNSQLWVATIRDGELSGAHELKLPSDGILESKDQRSFTSSFHLNKDGTKILISFSSSTIPTNIWEIDVEKNSCRQITFSDVGDLKFVPSELMRFSSFDGLVVPYFFYMGKGEGALPTILHIHGGPEGMYRPGFRIDVQLFTEMGYNVVAPNIRGSHGYGRLYLSLDDVEKRLDSIADIKALAEHIREDDRVDGNRLVVYGGSYGGFAVLSSITEYPETYACAVDIVGISDFETFLEKTAAWRRRLREVEYGFLDRDREVLRRISPIHKVGDIVTPTLIIQGDNDERVPLNESIQIYEELSRRGIKCKLLRFADEGHGVTKKKNQKVMFAEILSFMREALEK